MELRRDRGRIAGVGISGFQTVRICNSFITMLKVLCVLLACSLAAARDFPQYNQCDPKWKD